MKMKTIEIPFTSLYRDELWSDVPKTNSYVPYIENEISIYMEMSGKSYEEIVCLNSIPRINQCLILHINNDDVASETAQDFWYLYIISSLMTEDQFRTAIDRAIGQTVRFLKKIRSEDYEIIIK